MLLPAQSGKCTLDASRSGTRCKGRPILCGLQMKCGLLHAGPRGGVACCAGRPVRSAGQQRLVVRPTVQAPRRGVLVVSAASGNNGAVLNVSVSAAMMPAASRLRLPLPGAVGVLRPPAWNAPLRQAVLPALNGMNALSCEHDRGSQHVVQPLFVCSASRVLLHCTSRGRGPRRAGPAAMGLHAIRQNRLLLQRSADS